MDNKTVFKVEFQDGGTIRAKTEDAKAFNKESGKAVAAAKAASSVYDQARAGAGTGAAGRDFANQAQGLGGLVRVYATFAANIFAVSAAFNALSNAADTTNLVKGLDQLGSASGKNLGTLSKRIVEATDNSVSLREAMTATAQASAAGMSTGDILKLAKGAKQASQALGIDMSDALSRLSRGITKIEPELLDELGIFVRVDKAAQDYATSIGKPVSALTEFEKRASFSSAVLTQLNAKFGALEIDANPYNQLLASLKNVATSGLELLNKVLGPIASILASNPTALLLVMGAIATTLLRQAIPALSSWRENLEKTRSATAEAASETKRLYDEYRSGIIEKDMTKQAVAFKNASTAVNTHVTALKELEGINKRTGLARSITTFAESPTAENAAVVQRLALQRTADIQAQKDKGVSADRVKALDLELAGIAKLNPAITDLTKSTTALNKASSDYKGVSAGYFSLAAQYERIDKSARAAATSINIVSNAAANTQFGALNALIMASKEISMAYSAGNISKVGAFFTAIKAGSAIAMVGVSTLISSMAGILNIVAVVVGFGTLLASIFSKNSKEVSAFTSAIDELKSSFDNVDRTLSTIGKKDLLGQLNVESIQARANAFSELTDKVGDSKKAFEVLAEASNNWLDSSTQWIKSWVDMDAASVLAEQMAASVPKALLLLEKSADKDTLSAGLIKALGVDNLSKTAIAEKLKEALVSGNEKVLKDFTNAMEATGRATASSAADLTNFSNVVTQSVKATQEYTNTFNLSDPLAKLGVSLLLVSDSMEKLKGSTEDAQSGILNLMSDTKRMTLFGDEFAEGLLRIRDSYQKGSAEVKKYNGDLEAQRLKLLELEAIQNKPKSTFEKIGAAILAPIANTFGLRNDTDGVKEAADVARQKGIYDAAKVAADAAIARFKLQNIDAQKIITDGMHTAFVSGSNLIEQSLKNASAEAAITMAKGATGLLTGTAALSAESKLAQESYKIQVQAISVNESLILSQARLTNSVDTSNKLAAMALAEKDKGANSPEFAAAKVVYEAGLEAGKALRAGGAAISAAIKTAKGSESGTTESMVGQELRGTATSLAGINAARVTANAGMKALEVKQAGAMPGAITAETTAVKLAQEKALNTVAAERLDINKDIIGVASVEIVLAKNKLDMSNLTNDASLTSATLQGTISGLIAQQKLEAAQLLKGELTSQQVLVTTNKLNAAKVDLKKVENLELKGQLAVQVAIEQSAARELALTQSKRNLDSSIASNALDIQSAIITKKLELGTITIDQANAEEYANNVAKLRLDTTNNLSKAQDDLNTLTKTYEGRSLTVSIEELGTLNSEYDRNSAILRNNITVIQAKGDASLKVAEISKKNSEKETAYANLFNSSVASMSDSLVDFAFTGKQSFAELINSMIMELVRLEMRMLAVKAISESGGSFSIISSIGKMFMGGGPSTFTNDAGGTELAGSLGFAKGGSFDQGVQAFAKGGAFTNSIVNSPTLFKFAKGAGMMGEAGPEAIMPLKRNSNGVLGVEGGGGGGETNVIINNYGPSKTETKRTVDSRGNKTIEVIVGDAVAGEIRRSGSPAQESIKSTFGRQPQLIRR